MGGDSFLSYVYHAPWGMTSQGALYAMTQRRFAHERGYTESDLGAIAVAARGPRGGEVVGGHGLGAHDRTPPAGEAVDRLLVPSGQRLAAGGEAGQQRRDA